MTLRISLHVAVALLFALPIAAAADKWDSPRPMRFTSRNGEFAFLSTPSPTWVEHVGKASGELRRVSDDSLIWRGPLVNEVSPVRAVVADDGRFVVTFDDWYAMGYGRTTIVVYGSSGEVLQSLPLDHVVSASERIRLPTSISSIHWGGEHSLEGEILTLAIQVMPWRIFEAHEYEPYREWSRSEDRFTHRRLNVLTGALLDRPEPHPLDQLPDHECPPPLKPRSSLGPEKHHSLLTACVAEGGAREGPATAWRATEAGWVLAERGQYHANRKSGVWQRWSAESEAHCVARYLDGDLLETDCQ